MSKKILALVLAIAMVIGLAACTSTPAASDTPSESTQTSDTPSESTATGDPITLPVCYYGMTDDAFANIWETNKETNPDLEEGEFTDGLQKVNYTFKKITNEEYPQYKVEFCDWGWSEELDQKIRAQLTAGDPPAVVAGEVSMPSYALEGILSEIPQDIVDSVYGSFLLNDPDGKPVGIATSSALFHLYYNIDILEKAGFSEDDVPKTWEEWQTISAAITEKGNGEYWGGGIPSFPHMGGALRATPFLRQMGVDFGTADSAELLSDPKTIETLEYIRTMNAYLPAGTGNATDENALWSLWDDKGTGTIAFVIDGTFRGQNNALSGINAGVADLPLPEGGVEANCAVGSVIIGVPKAFKEQDAAFEMVRLIISPEVSTGWVENYRVVPSKEIMDNDELFKDASDTLLAARELYRGDEPVEGLVTFNKNSSAIWEIIDQKVLSAATMTETPIEDLVKQAQTEIDNLLK